MSGKALLLLENSELCPTADKQLNVAAIVSVLSKKHSFFMHFYSYNEILLKKDEFPIFKKKVA